MIVKKKFLILCLLFVLFASTIKAQSIRYRLYDKSRNALSSDLIKGLSQDANGYVWLATDNGICKFNGKYFLRLNVKLPSNYVKALFFKSNGNMLASTDLGYVELKITGDSAKIINSIQGTTNQTDTTLHYPKLFYEDKKMNLWITDDMSVSKINKNKLKRYKFPKIVKSRSYHRTFILVENSYGNLFAFSQNGYAFMFNTEQDTFIQIEQIKKPSEISYALAQPNGIILLATKEGILELQTNTQSQIIKSENVLTGIDASYLLQTDDNLIVASTWYNGIYFISKVKNSFIASKCNNFPFKRTNFLIKDQYKNIFVATDAGLVLLQFNYFMFSKNEISQSYINTLHSGKNNKMWLTTGENIYSTKYENNNITLIKYPAPIIAGIYTNAINSAHTKNSVWLATNSAMLYYLENEKVVRIFDCSDLGRCISYCFEDKDMNLWLLIDGFNGVARITPNFERKLYSKEKGIEKQLFVIKQDKKGKIFGGASSNKNYLYEFDNKKDIFINRSIFSEVIPEKDFYVNDIAFGKNEEIWLGTNIGLFYYSKNTISKIDFKQLNNNLIYSLTIDNRGDLWLANTNGIFKYRNNSLSFFNQENGLSTITSAYRCFICDSANRLWLGTSLGLNISENNSPTFITPSPRIEKLFSNNTQLDLNNGKIRIKQGSSLIINYSAVCYPADEIIYQYKLNTNQNWLDLDNRTELVLTDLHSGKYILLIQARQQGNYLWSKSVELQFEVFPPWYSTFWGICSIIIIIGLFTYIVVHLNSKRLLIVNMRLEKIIKKRTSEVIEKNCILAQQNEEIQTQTEELNTLNEALNQKNTELIKINSGKDKFMSIIAHDLRSPFHLILGFSKLLLENFSAYNKETTHEYIRFINSSAKNALGLLENLLSWAKSQSGQIEYKPENISIQNIFAEINEFCSSLAKSKNIVLEFHNKVDIVFADANMLKTIFRNLISNAIKFTKKSGNVTVIVVANDEGIFFEVQDTGIGMDKRTIDELFELNNNYSTSGTDGEKGSGLGLLLCKEFIERHFGRIWVESEIGKGTSIKFMLPNLA